MKQTKQIVYTFLFFALTVFACVDNNSADIDELKEEIDALKLLLEENNKISEILIEEDSLIFLFGDGSSISTALPNNEIPVIGPNGNWWVGSDDLGEVAGNVMPLVNPNGNWWVGDKDTGVKAKISPRGVSNVDYDQTTGILTIILGDGTVYEFLLSYDASLSGVKLSDLNGEYMVSAIYNGDLPFVSFEYDVNNRLIEVTYYTTLLNNPVKYLTIERTYNANGDIATQTYTEWATKKKAVPRDEYFANKQEGIEMEFEDAYNEIWSGGVKGYSGDGYAFFSEFRTPIYSSNGYLYQINENGSKIKKCLMRESYDKSVTFGAINSELWFNDYDENKEEWDQEYKNINAVSASNVSYGSGFSTGPSAVKRYYKWFVPTYNFVLDSDPIDIVTENMIEDYIYVYTPEVEVILGIVGDYKALFYTYDVYETGDVIDSRTIYYTYDGADFTIRSEEEENEDKDVLNIKVEGGKITKLVAYIDEEEDPHFEDMLGFNYTDGKLSTIDFLQSDIKGLVGITYDSKGNPIEFGVKPSALEETQDYEGADPEILAALGLIYSYDEYDSELGMVVEKYFYPEGYTSMISLSYDYGMKNFMNHTLTAVNPLMSFFESSHSINQIGWAGHGSAIFSEHLKYNEGGYPTEIKTYLQLSASDVPFEDSELEDFGIPINGSVAISYKLEYIKKQ
ncbi:hypothetical protein N6H18_04580 [Reichenbachiella agarivorans]|uniref:DUF4988 domain-containing protein n=1 Tax=Reichenbachiella agarivorans TaxID=2979464 RepID=A0ABY6CRU6_9BACT|nr:hypothetical protein [Reichenbachiella agarivorans]UXP33227.1 hypothetical protein N6H18_04580 [Reichenbachiella agarivorans]